MTIYPAMSEGFQDKFTCLECKQDVNECNCIWAAIRDLQSKLKKVTNQISSCIDVGLMHQEMKNRETWQKGCEVNLNRMTKQIHDLQCGIQTDSQGYKWKFSPEELINKVDEICSHVGVPTPRVIHIEVEKHAADALGYLDPSVKGRLPENVKTERPSRQHLERCLADKNKMLKEINKAYEQLANEFKEVEYRNENQSESIKALVIENDGMRCHIEALKNKLDDRDSVIKKHEDRIRIENSIKLHNAVNHGRCCP